MPKFCCNKFEENKEQSEDLNINGCCDGGCYVLSDITYCPLCGTNLENSKMNNWFWRNYPLSLFTVVSLGLTSCQILALGVWVISNVW